MPKDRSKRENEKTAALDSAREKSGDHFLTTDQGLRINDDQNSLKAGARGPSRTIAAPASSRGRNAR